MSIFMSNRLNLKIKTHINATKSAHLPLCRSHVSHLFVVRPFRYKTVNLCGLKSDLVTA